MSSGKRKKQQLFGQFAAVRKRSAGTTPLGQLFSETTWSALTNYAATGSTFSVTGGELNMTGGIASFNDRLEFNQVGHAHRYSCLEYWKQKVRVRTPATVNGASTYGFGIGINSTGAEDYTTCIRWIWDTAQNAQVVRYAQRGFTNQVYSGAGNTFVAAANTVYTIEVERVKTALSYRIYDSAGTTLLFSYTFTWDLSAGYVQSPNTGRFCIWNFGGTNIRILEWTVTSIAKKGADYILISDSIGSGLWAVTTGGRYFEQVMSGKGKSFEILAGIADRTADVINRIPEVVALAPKNVVICIASNDVANGVASGTWQANINTMISTLQGAGITVKLADAVARNVDLTAIQTFIAGKANQKVSFFAATKNGGNTALQAAYGGSVDGIHPNLAGHNQLATTLDAII